MENKNNSTKNKKELEKNTSEDAKKETGPIDDEPEVDENGMIVGYYGAQWEPIE